MASVTLFANGLRNAANHTCRREPNVRRGRESQHHPEHARLQLTEVEYGGCRGENALGHSQLSAELRKRRDYSKGRNPSPYDHCMTPCVREKARLNGEDQPRYVYVAGADQHIHGGHSFERISDIALNDPGAWSFFHTSRSTPTPRLMGTWQRALF
mgnify:CR=1 FL=1